MFMKCKFFEILFFSLSYALLISGCVGYEQNTGVEIMSTNDSTVKTSISAGGGHSMAIDQNNNLWAWGNNDHGQIGDGTTTTRYEPIKIMRDVIAVSAGLSHSLAITSDNTLWAWGRNTSGQLGDGTNYNQSQPQKIMENVLAVAAGSTHTMAICANYVLWAWGSNASGQLGISNVDYAFTRLKVLDNIAYVSTSSFSTMAITQYGELWGWGGNINGQIGNGTKETQFYPIWLMNHVESVSTGFSYTVAVKNDNTLWGWGFYNHNYFCAFIDKQYLPVKISNYITAATAGTNLLSISIDGTLSEWYWPNLQLQEGIFITPDHIAPNQVLYDVAFISSGGSDMAVMLDGTLWVWGSVYIYNLGLSTIDIIHTPKQMLYNMFLPLEK